MLKKIFKAVTTFAFLVGCYFGYVQIFGLVVGQSSTVRQHEIALENHDSNSKLESIRRAKAVMPPGHWATKSDLNFRYYNKERGYWMYAQELEQVQEENDVRYNGKRIRLSPFLVISTSRDGKKTDIITSDRAVIDLNQPLGFGSGPDGEALKVKHVRLEPNVLIRDNKGTPDDPNDDMQIGPLTNLEFDEPTQQITTESHVIIEDSDMIITGDGMRIQLRSNDVPQPGGSSSFDGAKYLELLKNVHVVMHDSGMMPGMKQPNRSADRLIEARLQVAGGPVPIAQLESVQQPTPLNVTCDSRMRVDLPRPRLPVIVGPPAPPAPTIVQFDRNVVVLRGQVDDQPGQLTCDTLKLTLVPSETAPDKQAGPSRKGDTGKQTASDKQAASEKITAENKDGLFGSLTLERAHATGHAVWLYLPTDGIKLRCNELIHMHRAPYKPDLTYFRGDLTRQL